MECLDIPVDHRLLHIIQHLQFPVYTETSDHLNILKGWGESLTWDGARLKNTRIHHALELAKPATKGGVLVALLQPHSSQEFDKGFVADVHDCRTTRAVRDLVVAATGGRMGLDDVSVFDTLPYCADDTHDAAILEKARRIFSRMVEAKKPDVVLCCYRVGRSDTDNPIVRGLSSRGVGKVHDELEFTIYDGSTTKRINAFHPSYAVNYYPTYGCFRRLLLVEFVQAFSHYSGAAGIEEKWIRELREECARVVKDLLREEEERRKENLYRPRIDEGRWENILNNLNQSIATLGYFKRAIGVDKVVRSNLSWICADASLFLTEVMRHREEEPDEAEKIGFRLIEGVLEPWCWEIYGDIELSNNEEVTDPRGYFDSRSLMVVPELPRGAPARNFHNHVMAFLLDLNLSFKYEGGSRWTWHAVEHRRLAANLERTTM